MIVCPKCQKSLPDWAKSCQFCGADTTKVNRPVPIQKERRPMATDAQPWVWWAYYLIASYFVLGGIFVVLSGMGVLGKDLAAGGSCLAIMGLVNIILGAGLILRWEAIRGIVNVVCFITMIGAAWSAVQGFFLSPLTGPFAALFLIQNVIDFCTAGFMIFLLGETDKKAPNL